MFEFRRFTRMNKKLSLENKKKRETMRFYKNKKNKKRFLHL